VLLDGCCFGLQARLRLLPQIVIDDPQGWDTGFDNDVLGMRAHDMPPTDGVTLAGVPIPDLPPGIERIPQQPIVTRAPAADGPIMPGPAVRPGHTLDIECAGDGERAGPADIVAKDAPDDGGAGRVDLAQTPHRLAISAEGADGSIPIGQAPGPEPMAGAPLQTAVRLLRQILEVERPHRALEPDVQL
jgi:hypothetical protein